MRKSRRQKFKIHTKLRKLVSLCDHTSVDGVSHAELLRIRNTLAERGRELTPSQVNDCIRIIKMIQS